MASPVSVTTTLVVGASGATGQQLCSQLLNGGHKVKAMVRTTLPALLLDHPQKSNLQTVQASILDLSAEELQAHVTGCDAVVSCLGHTLSFSGMFFPPRRLCCDAAKRLCEAITAVRVAEGESEKAKTKFVLINTTGAKNNDLDERAFSWVQTSVLSLLRWTLPPHCDNEEANEYLRTVVTDNQSVEWVAVRPDGLEDEAEVTEYAVFPSPIRDMITNSGTVSRINVAAFMASLVTDDAVWKEWQGRMPCVYNAASAAEIFPTSAATATPTPTSSEEKK